MRTRQNTPVLTCRNSEDATPPTPLRAKRSRLSVLTILIGAAVVLALSIALTQRQAHAQTQGQTRPQPKQAQETETLSHQEPDYLGLKRLDRQGYVIMGPVQVTKVTSNVLYVYRPVKEIEIPLKDRDVTVKDTRNRTSSLGKITQNNRVYVCVNNKLGKVLIIVLPEKEVSNEQ